MCKRFRWTNFAITWRTAWVWPAVVALLIQQMLPAGLAAVPHDPLAAASTPLLCGSAGGHRGPELPVQAPHRDHCALCFLPPLHAAPTAPATLAGRWLFAPTIPAAYRDGPPARHLDFAAAQPRGPPALV